MESNDYFPKKNIFNESFLVFKEQGPKVLAVKIFRKLKHEIRSALFSSMSFAVRLHKSSSIIGFRPLPRRLATGNKKVSIVIPFHDMPEMLKCCIESIFMKTNYENYEIILIDHQSTLVETRNYLETLRLNTRISVVKYEAPFNYSAIHNFIFPKIKNELVLLLNNDMEVINPEWLSELVSQIELPDVGAVGALLLYPDNTVQHAGIGLSISYAGPTHIFRKESVDGKNAERINCIQEYCAVTGACLMTKKSLYKKVAGMDAEHLPVAYNDVDYCLKLRENGYRVIYNPFVRLYHYESVTRGYDSEDPVKEKRVHGERKFFIKKWGKYRFFDPFL